MGCSVCYDGNGWVFVYLTNYTSTQGATVFRCNCSQGQGKWSSGIPTWQERYRDRYTFNVPAYPTEPEPEAPRKPTEKEVEFIRQVAQTKDWDNSEFKQLLERYGKDQVKQLILEGAR